MTVTLCETQLYEPVRQYWTAAGYEVRGEVASCDVIAYGGDEWIAIELKTSLNLEVILQAVQRQKMVSQVWIAIPRPGGRAMHSQRWQRLMHLLRRLELGLLLVNLGRQPAGVEAALLAIPFDRAQSQSQNKGKARRLRQEFERRHGDRNPGGIHRTALMTAYREQALLTAALLERGGSACAAKLRRQGGPANTYSILYKNHYGWFARSGSGQYDLTAEGREALAVQAELAALLLAEIESGKTEAESGR